MWHFIKQQCEHTNSSVLAGHGHGELNSEWHSHISIKIKLLPLKEWIPSD